MIPTPPTDRPGPLRPSREQAWTLLREAAGFALAHPGALTLMTAKSLCLFVCLLAPLAWLSSLAGRQLGAAGLVGAGSSLFFLLGAPLAVNVCRAVVLGESLSVMVFRRLVQPATLRLAGCSLMLTVVCGACVLALFALPARVAGFLLVTEEAAPLAVLVPVAGLWLVLPRLALAWLILVDCALGRRPRLARCLKLPQSVALPLSAVLGVCLAGVAALILGLDAAQLSLSFAGHGLWAEAAFLAKPVAAALGQAAALVPVAKVYARHVHAPDQDDETTQPPTP